ncbi:MAG: serine hydrolase domain-containing protein [Myxococcota bacterium]
MPFDRQHTKSLSPLVMAGLITACGSSAPASPEPANPQTFDAAALDAELNRIADGALAQEGVPSFVLRVDAPCLGYTFETARGFADGEAEEPMTPGHGFWTASTTKTMTSVIVLQLVERGLLRLEDTLIDHLPADLVDRVHVLDGVSRGREVRVDQLIGHTSGLWDHASAGTFFATLLDNPGKFWIPDELVEWATVNGEPVGLPGEQYHYSDFGYLLAGLIIESVTGEPIHEVYRRLIFEPLGMASTFQGGHEERANVPVARPFFATLDIVDLGIDPSFDWAAGGVIATAADLNRFYAGLFSGALLSEESVRMMLRGVAPDVPGRVPGREYGLGILKPLSDGEDWRGHSGFWGSWAGHSIAQNVTVAFSTSQSEASRSDIQRAVFAAIPDFECADGTRLSTQGEAESSY